MRYTIKMHGVVVGACETTTATNGAQRLINTFGSKATSHLPDRESSLDYCAIFWDAVDALEAINGPGMLMLEAREEHTELERLAEIDNDMKSSIGFDQELARVSRLRAFDYQLERATWGLRLAEGPYRLVELLYE